MQLPLDNDPARDRQQSAPGGDPEGAATLTAAMVRRGHNPWWGKDQIAADAATTSADDDSLPDGDPADSATTRKPFHRIDIDDGDNGGNQNGGAKRFSFDWRDSALWRDVAVFLGVFFTAASAMLYLSLRAL